MYNQLNASHMEHRIIPASPLAIALTMLATRRSSDGKFGSLSAFDELSVWISLALNTSLQSLD